MHIADHFDDTSLNADADDDKHQVTGSPSFLALSQKHRGGCQLHEREACQAQVRLQPIKAPIKSEACQAQVQSHC